MIPNNRTAPINFLLPKKIEVRLPAGHVEAIRSLVLVRVSYVSFINRQNGGGTFSGVWRDHVRRLE